MVDAGPSPALAKLPPYDVLGARWTHRYVAGTTVTVSTQVLKQVTGQDGGLRIRHRGVYSTGNVVTETDFDVSEGRIRWDYGTGNGYPTTYTPAIEVVRAPISVGDRWEQRLIASNSTATATYGRLIQVVGVETVTVPAGTFRCAKLQVTVDGGWEVSHTEWWNEDVGLVRSTSYDFVLTSFARDGG